MVRNATSTAVTVNPVPVTLSPVCAGLAAGRAGWARSVGHRVDLAVTVTTAWRNVDTVWVTYVTVQPVSVRMVVWPAGRGSRVTKLAMPVSMGQAAECLVGSVRTIYRVTGVRECVKPAVSPAGRANTARRKNQSMTFY